MFKEFLAFNKLSNGYKQNLVNAYNHYAEDNNLAWIPPKYRREETVLDVPAEETVNKLVAYASRKNLLENTFISLLYFLTAYGDSVVLS